MFNLYSTTYLFHEFKPILIFEFNYIFLTSSKLDRGPRNYFDILNFSHFLDEIARSQLFETASKKNLKKLLAKGDC